MISRLPIDSRVKCSVYIFCPLPYFTSEKFINVPPILILYFLLLSHIILGCHVPAVHRYSPRESTPSSIHHQLQCLLTHRQHVPRMALQEGIAYFCKFLSSLILSASFCRISRPLASLLRLTKPSQQRPCSAAIHLNACQLS